MGTFPSKLVEWTADEVKKILRDTVTAGGQSVPEFIAGDPPESLMGKINQDTLRRLCRRWASSPGDYSPEVSANNSQKCEPYLRDIGQWPGDPTAQNGFKGGQCAIPYKVIAYGVSTNDPPDTTPYRVGSANNVIGPILGTTSIGTGDTLYVQSVGSGDVFLSQPVRPGAYLVVTPMPGFTDDCGDGPSSYNPPTGTGQDDGEPKIISPAPGFDVTLNVDMSFDGEITINIGGTESEPFNPYTPVPDPEDDPTNPDFPGDTGDEGESSDTGVGGETEGEDEDKYLVGVRVNVVSFPAKANILFVGDVAVFRGPGYVYLGGEGGLDLQAEAAYMRDGQFFFAPKGSNKYLVSANNGYNLRVTPFWKEQE